MNLLDDLVVIDFSQFLSGPSAGLRLADMGAQVIKIEKPYVGDICRELYVSDVMIDVFDTTGNKVYSKADTNSYLDKEVVLNYNFNIGLQKVYIIRVTTKLGHSEQKVLSSPY